MNTNAARADADADATVAAAAWDAYVTALATARSALDFYIFAKDMEST